MSVLLGHGIRNSRVADLALGAHQPLRHRSGGDEKCAGDLVGLEAAQRAERQRDLRFDAQAPGGSR